MKTVVITTWHKVDSKVAMTYKQLEYISTLRTSENCPEWPFSSKHNAIRSLTKFDALEIIDALKSGDRVIFE